MIMVPSPPPPPPPPPSTSSSPKDDAAACISHPFAHNMANGRGEGEEEEGGGRAAAAAARLLDVDAQQKRSPEMGRAHSLGPPSRACRRFLSYTSNPLVHACLPSPSAVSASLLAHPAGEMRREGGGREGVGNGCEWEEHHTLTEDMEEREQNEEVRDFFMDYLRQRKEREAQRRTWFHIPLDLLPSSFFASSSSSLHSSSASSPSSSTCSAASTSSRSTVSTSTLPASTSLTHPCFSDGHIPSSLPSCVSTSSTSATSFCVRPPAPPLPPPPPPSLPPKLSSTSSPTTTSSCSSPSLPTATAHSPSPFVPFSFTGRRNPSIYDPVSCTAEFTTARGHSRGQHGGKGGKKKKGEGKEELERMEVQSVSELFAQEENENSGNNLIRHRHHPHSRQRRHEEKRKRRRAPPKVSFFPFELREEDELVMEKDGSLRRADVVQVPPSQSPSASSVSLSPCTPLTASPPGRAVKDGNASTMMTAPITVFTTGDEDEISCRGTCTSHMEVMSLKVKMPAAAAASTSADGAASAPISVSKCEEESAGEDKTQEMRKRKPKIEEEKKEEDKRLTSVPSHTRKRSPPDLSDIRISEKKKDDNAERGTSTSSNGNFPLANRNQGELHEGEKVVKERKQNQQKEEEVREEEANGSDDHSSFRIKASRSMKEKNDFGLSHGPDSQEGDICSWHSLSLPSFSPSSFARKDMKEGRRNEENKREKQKEEGEKKEVMSTSAREEDSSTNCPPPTGGGCGGLSSQLWSVEMRHSSGSVSPMTCASPTHVPQQAVKSILLKRSSATTGSIPGFSMMFHRSRPLSSKLTPKRGFSPEKYPDDGEPPERGGETNNKNINVMDKEGAKGSERERERGDEGLEVTPLKNSLIPSHPPHPPFPLPSSSSTVEEHSLFSSAFHRTSSQKDNGEPQHFSASLPKDEMKEQGGEEGGAGGSSGIGSSVVVRGNNATIPSTSSVITTPSLGVLPSTHKERKCRKSRTSSAGSTSSFPSIQALSTTSPTPPSPFPSHHDGNDGGGGIEEEGPNVLISNGSSRRSSCSSTSKILGKDRMAALPYTLLLSSLAAHSFSPRNSNKKEEQIVYEIAEDLQKSMTFAPDNNNGDNDGDSGRGDGSSRSARQGQPTSEGLPLSSASHPASPHAVNIMAKDEKDGIEEGEEGKLKPKRKTKKKVSAACHPTTNMSSQSLFPSFPTYSPPRLIIGANVKHTDQLVLRAREENYISLSSSFSSFFLSRK